MQYVETENMSMQEQLSALHDGELLAADAQALVRASLADERLMHDWRSMSAISAVLREQQGASKALRPAAGQSELILIPTSTQPLQAANDGVFRWKMVAGLAAFAAVGSLAWGLLGSVGDKAGLQNGAVLAQSQGAPAAGAGGQGLITVGGQLAGQEITMVRDPRLDELLAAHKQFGGISALQQPVGSLRSVSLSGPLQ